ncbi:MAG: RodZ domain-containing protein [Pseudomonadota bacterium]
MIGRWASKVTDEERVEPKGFDDFELRLGDIMRGERATLGKSLLDVQRELRIKASYIAAIENSDPGAFDTPGFIAGYVRSYARYLGMDPDEAFNTFCAESGFSVAHGMSVDASSVKKAALADGRQGKGTSADPFVRPNTPFIPARESIFHQIEPGAIGSMVVLVALIGAIGFGGWSVLQEVQRVQLAPVDQTPTVLSNLDPLDGALSSAPEAMSASFSAQRLEAPRAEAFDRLYRPQALDVPVLVARDAAIATLDPLSVGNFADVTSNDRQIDGEGDAEVAVQTAVPQVVEAPKDTVRMIAASPSWVRVQAADGSILFETTMNRGDVYDIPTTEEPPMLRAGNSGAIYFATNDGCYGPVGPSGAVTANLPLHYQALAELYQPVDPDTDSSLTGLFADLAATSAEPQQAASFACKTE